MCPPTHFSHTTRPRPFPASFSLISLPDKFFPPSHSTQPATPFCGCACLVWVWSVSVVHVVPAWIGGERRREKKTLCKLWEHYETDAGAHKLYGSFAYSWHKTLCKYWSICIMDSSCCLNCPVAAFYLIMKKNKECETRKNSMLEPYEAPCHSFHETPD